MSKFTEFASISISSSVVASLWFLRKRTDTGMYSNDLAFATTYTLISLLSAAILSIIKYSYRKYIDIIQIIGICISTCALFISVLTRMAVIKTGNIHGYIHATTKPITRSSVFGLYILYTLTTVSTGVLVIYLMCSMFNVSNIV
jgi:hypothetical protein